MELMVGYFALGMFALAAVSAAGRDDPCSSTSECSDTGLTCSGNRCVCLLNVGRKVARSWACNSASDCSGINVLAKQTLDISDLKVSRDPACFASNLCPNLPGSFGYCDVLMAA